MTLLDVCLHPSACHRSCKDKCWGGGPGDCEECASGYERSEDDVECKGQ